METKTEQSFELLELSEKQKQTTLEVHTLARSANEFAIYCDTCRGVHTCGYRL